MDQLGEATRIQGAEGGLPIGEVLLQKVWITPDQLKSLVQHQRDYVAKRQAAGKPGAAQAAPGPAAAPGASPARPVAVAPGAAARVPAAPRVTGAEPRSAAALEALLARAVELRGSDLHV